MGGARLVARCRGWGGAASLALRPLPGDAGGVRAQWAGSWRRDPPVLDATTSTVERGRARRCCSPRRVCVDRPAASASDARVNDRAGSDRFRLRSCGATAGQFPFRRGAADGQDVSPKGGAGGRAEEGVCAHEAGQACRGASASGRATATCLGCGPASSATSGGDLSACDGASSDGERSCTSSDPGGWYGCRKRPDGLEGRVCRDGPISLD